MMERAVIETVLDFVSPGEEFTVEEIQKRCRVFGAGVEMMLDDLWKDILR
ncbi:MAG: hypothetical protein OK422_04395 [Thaumarchaeota archaeon]|nr:hypothetical protein [Nitrososphaerota archaeon]